VMGDEQGKGVSHIRMGADGGVSGQEAVVVVQRSSSRETTGGAAWGRGQPRR
jgi:hypothetical protein